MRFYRYRAINSESDIVKDIISMNLVKGVSLSYSKEELINKLKEFNFDILRVKRTLPTIVSYCDFYLFMHHLHSLLSVPIPIDQSLSILFAGKYSVNFKLLCFESRANIISGKNLSEALQLLKAPVFVVTRIYSGEISGEMLQSLKDAKDYLNGEIKRNEILKNSIRYPIVLFIFFLFIVISSFFWVIPVFEEILSEEKENHFMLFKVLFGTILSLLSIAIIITIIICTLRIISKRFSYRLDKWICKKNKTIANSKLILVLLPISYLLNSKIHILESIKLVKEKINDLFLEEFCEKILECLKSGDSFSSALEKQNISNKMLVDSMRIGEKTGNLSSVFLKTCLFLRDDLDFKKNRMLNVLGPVLVAISGILILLVVLSTLVPLYDTLLKNAISS